MNKQIRPVQIWGGILLVVFGANAAICRTASAQQDLRFETRELSAEEIKRLGYDKVDSRDAESMSERFGEEDFAPQEGETTESCMAEVPILNALAGVAKTPISPSDSNVNGTVFAHCTPPGVEPFDLQGGRAESKVYEKKLISVILRTALVTLHYRISFRYQMTHEKRGAYLANVKFTPLKVDLDPIWSLEATGVSEKPVNVGTEKNPVAQVAFSITFKVKGVGTMAVTDEFEVNAKDGKIRATIRDFE